MDQRERCFKCNFDMASLESHINSCKVLSDDFEPVHGRRQPPVTASRAGPSDRSEAGPSGLQVPLSY